MPYKINRKKVESKNNALDLDKFRTMSEIIEDNYKSILSGAGVILLIGIVIGVYFMINSSSNKNALLLEKDAFKYYFGEKSNSEDSNNEGHGKDYKKAAENFQKVIDQYPGSISAKTALFYLGNTYYEQKDYDKSLEIYNKFIKQYPSDEIIIPLVYQKMGYSYLAKNNNTDAMNSFNKIISIKSAWNKDQSYYEIGRLHEIAGKNDEAIKTYENIIKESPKSPLKSEADSRLNLLRKSTESAEKKPVETEKKEEEKK